MLQATTSSSFGFFFSTLVQDDTTALICHNLVSFVLYFCSPAFSIIAQRKNILIDMLEPMSPFTYTCELLLRRLLDGSGDKDKVLEFYGYTKGETQCYFGLAAISLTYFLLSWVTTILKAQARLK